MDIEISKTERGFPVVTFKDKYDVECSVQRSSLAFENAIWIGANKANAQRLMDAGWEPYELPKDVVVTTRMHLTDVMVIDLLPILVCFAATGNLPEEDNIDGYREATAKLVNALGAI